MAFNINGVSQLMANGENIRRNQMKANQLKASWRMAKMAISSIVAAKSNENNGAHQWRGGVQRKIGAGEKALARRWRRQRLAAASASLSSGRKLCENINSNAASANVSAGSQQYQRENIMAGWRRGVMAKAK